MVKKSPAPTSKASQRGLWDEKESIFEDCQEQSTIPALDALKKEQQRVAQILPSQTAPIKKERKKRTFNPEGRFLQEHRRRFFLFPFYYSTRFPFCKISWENWKPTGYFIRMAEFLSNISLSTPNKSGEQCKSFDQRQKKEIYTDVDLLEAAFLELKESDMDCYSAGLLADYVQKMQSKSEYMTFLTQNEGIQGDKSSSTTATDTQVQSQRRNADLQYPIQSISDLIFNEFFDEEK